MTTSEMLRQRAQAHGGDALLVQAADELDKLRKDAERYEAIRRPRDLAWPIAVLTCVTQ